MGQEFFCDLCHKSLPNADALQPILFGTDKIADLCLTCSSALKTGIQKKLAEAQAAFSAAVQQPEAPLPEQPPAPAPPPAPPEVPPPPAAAPGGK